MNLVTEPKAPGDIWDLPDAGPDARPADGNPVPLLGMQIIGGVSPLGDQLGVERKKTVPDALLAPLFGQPQPDQGKVADGGGGGDPARLPPVQTYAILDAAKSLGLPERLAASGLDHRCLFKGKARDELGDAAPWIVQLDQASDFCRHLFTEGDAPWQMWGRGPGIYIRSRASLDALWGYFRKFTRVQDETGKWFYFRFYDPACAAATESLLYAIESSILRPLTFPALMIVTGPDVKESRAGRLGHDQI